MDKIQLESDVVYKSENNKKLLLDICYPIDLDKKIKYPTVLLINGGVGSPLKFSSRFRDIFLSWGKLISSFGFIAISFVWRYKFPQDITTAIDFIRNNANSYNIDIEYFPPLLLVMAKNDKYFPINCNDMFNMKYRATGANVKTLLHKTGEHAFDIRNNNKESHEIILKTIDFMKDNLM